MKKKFNKTIGSIIAGFAVISALSLTASASNNNNLGTLSYWDSLDDVNPDKIAKWSTNPVVSVILSDPNFTNLTPSITNAVYKWNTAFGSKLNVSYTIASSPVFKNIKVYGLGKSALASMFGKLYGADTVGYSWDKNSTQIGYYQYTSNNNTSKKWCYDYTETYLTVVNCELLRNNNNKCKMACLHEMGHCLGWMNHAKKTKGTNDIMKPAVDETTTLSTIDKRFLTQLY